MILSLMGQYGEAVDGALELGDVDLAKMNADKVQDDPEVLFLASLSPVHCNHLGVMSHATFAYCHSSSPFNLLPQVVIPKPPGFGPHNPFGRQDACRWV